MISPATSAAICGDERLSMTPTAHSVSSTERRSTAVVVTRTERPCAAANSGISDTSANEPNPTNAAHVGNHPVKILARTIIESAFWLLLCSGRSANQSPGRGISWPFKSRAVGRIHGCPRQRRHRRETRPRLERVDSALQPELYGLDDSRLRLAVKKSPSKRAKTIHHTESILRQDHSFCGYDGAMMYSRIPCRTQSEAEPRFHLIVLESFESNVAVVISYWVPEP